MTPNAHTLTLKFHRFLTEDEWRDVAEHVLRLPVVQELVANAVEESPGELARRRLVDER